MNNIHILCLSDIHFDKNEPENQGLVVKEFFTDLPKVIANIDKDSLYCIISGDLVHTGVEKHYKDFADIFIKKLQKYLLLDHIIVVAGNHDMNRGVLFDKDWKKRQNKLVDSTVDEKSYNVVLKEEKDSVVFKKFEYFNQFVNEKLLILGFNLFGYEINIVPDISIYCLNTALLSNGGLKGFPKDQGNLRIETNGLYRWTQENEGRTKILVMHHPIHYLTEYAQSVLDNNIRKHIDVVITGHLHKNDFKQYLGKDDDTVKYCSSPQLFSDKRDQNGYSLIHFKDNKIDSIEYRKWSTINEEFTVGTEFSRTLDGRITFRREEPAMDDYVRKELQDRLNQSLCVYNYSPSWVDRVISNVAPGMSMKEEDVVIWDHINVVNSLENIQIVGGAQFGLTCFAHKMVLEAWNIKKEHWLYVDGKELRISKVQTVVDGFVRSRNIQYGDIKTVVIDNCNKTYDNSEKIMEKIGKILPDVRIVLLNNEDDAIFFAGINNNSFEEGYSLFYLRELSRKGIRQISKEFIERQRFDMNNSGKILERLINQLLDLNVHRIPINCLQLLFNFQQNYDAHPIDRTKILKSLIMFFFLKPDSYFYTDAIDETDCCIIMGKLCETLMRTTDGKSYNRYFTEEEYKKATNSLDGKYNEELRLKLLRAMLDAQIIVPYLNIYEFRFSYWVYFFAAYQMYIDPAFYSYMVETAKCIYMPDIVEFYSGIDPKCDPLVEQIAEELLSLSGDVTTNLVPVIVDPYPSLKFRQNPNLDNKTKEQLEEGIRASKLPNDVKDAFMEQRDDNTRPYFQMINNVLDRYKVRNMMSLARSAGRALRNGQHIKDENRNNLYVAVQVSWVALLKVLQLLTPILARTGHGDLGGACFRLAGGFPEEESKRMVAVLTSLPCNVVDWYRNDVFSEKRFVIYRDAITGKDVPSICRHMNVLLMIRCRPKGWHELVENYIDSVGKNSFYIADVKNMLNFCYRIDEMSQADEKRTAKLLIAAVEKMKKSYMDPDKDRYFKTRSHKPMLLLPKREVPD
jgi:predicted phosphodiesterase